MTYLNKLARIEADFRAWWHNEGGGMCPRKGEDAEIHVRRVSEIAWKNGAFKAEKHAELREKEGF